MDQPELMPRRELDDLVLEMMENAISQTEDPDTLEWYAELNTAIKAAIKSGGRFEQGIYDELESQGYAPSDFEAGVW